MRWRSGWGVGCLLVTIGSAGCSDDTGGSDTQSAATDSSVSTDGSSASADETAEGGSGIDPANGDRVVTVTSECAGQTVVVGINGGYVEDCGAGDSCPDGTSCLTTRDPPGCFWDFPAPSSGSPVLAAGDSVTYELTAPPIMQAITSGAASGQTINVKWSGNLYASTQCESDGSGCQTAMCGVSEAGMTVVQPCANGVGPQGPASLAEFTFSFDGSDFYDISIINGANIPISMGPDGGTQGGDDPYTCETAGSATGSASGLLGCSWNFDPQIELDGMSTDQSTLLQAVAPGGTACTSDDECGAGLVCGTAITFGGSTIETVCGAPLGWWTADELCIYTANTAGAPVNCSGAVPGQGMVTDLYGCNGFNPNSCYNMGAANPTCCGCPEWMIDGSTLPVPPGFTCYDTNPEWTALAEPWARFVKEACPTAYSFPFDDATSTFTCATPDPSTENPNTMNYTVTLCPGGNDGLG
ncbi:MAG: thaumatin family protein [Myxococcota bacterium]